MLMNWPERVWIYSPIRVFFQIREIREWLRLVGRAETENALEIGCGLGRGAGLLVNRMGFREVVAFDLEERLIVRAVKSNPDSLKQKISFYVGDAQDLPFRDSSFDAVVNFGIIHHVLDWRRCISELSRVLRPGGLFYFEEIYPPLYANFLMKHVVRHPTEDRFSGTQFLEALASQGLCLVDGVRLESRFGIVGIARKSSA
ncbi:MAG: class I SAM-dependent methyltransferase [Desulfomonile tiedjei]|uniref:Class I SAM-dependent methyltransferase n=1 Tax=Desulfomonile tiedjei TaxID=2358 RepID=A0A9D6V1N0_9BACT|nr:class I SAM-dependent methyltransferase [Desulfomonile tiedjei]